MRFLSSNQAPQHSSFLKKTVFPVFLTACVLCSGWLVIDRLTKDKGDVQKTEEKETQQNVHDLELPQGKMIAGQFHSEPVQTRSIQHVHTVPGRIQYDELHHIEVKTSMDGILTTILVKPGDQVEEGQLLATVNSPVIGEARAEVLRRRAEYELAERRFNRESAIANNLESFLSLLEQKADLNRLDDEFQSKPLGEYRSKILSAYSRYLLQTRLAENIKPLEGTGSIAGRVLLERESELQIARSLYRSVREEASFEATQSQLEAQADFETANRLWKLAQQKLESLLGYAEKSVSMDTEASLSWLEIRAPFAGTIESRMKAEQERVEKSDPLFVLANTETLYISADIREKDWPAVTLEQGTVVQVTVPALENRVFSANVHYVGREVISATNSVPLVATIKNEECLLRPGMFVKVSLPVGPARESLSVRPQSILHHDQRQFVFLERGKNQFQAVDVITGISSDDWIEVQSGLEEGQLVVQEGAFLLKSEFLLEGESD